MEQGDTALGQRGLGQVARQGGNPGARFEGRQDRTQVGRDEGGRIGGTAAELLRQ